MKILILTGPAGVGKNTVAKVLSNRLYRAVTIDTDLVRQMIIKPHKAPWEGEEGKKQQMLGVENNILLAKNFFKNNYNVLILDVLSNETLMEYRNNFTPDDLKVVLLISSFEEIQKRNRNRTQYLKDEEIKMIFDSQLSLEGYDLKIDSTNLSAEDVASQLVEII